MEWVETTGRTVAEALDAALDMLGVHEDEVEFEVLAEPKAGFLGRFGGSEARLRARVKPVSREKPGDRRRRKQGRKRDGGGGERRGEGRRPRSGGRGTRPSADEKVRSNEREQQQMSESASIPVEEQAAAAVEFAAGLVEAFGFRADVTHAIDDDVINVDVAGDDLGLLVGPKGATLQAIEELVRAVVQRESGGHGARVYVDVAGYRAKRRVALEGFTRKIVTEVVDSGEEQVLEPMGAADRKVVHDTVNEIDGVETISEGEEPRRYVVIRPV